MEPYVIVDELDLDSIPMGEKRTFKLNMTQNALGSFWQVPVMVMKGGIGPVLGITACIHGNELNGISLIQKLWGKIEMQELKGTIVCVPVLNAPGFLMHQREFSDGKDLNRIMPGDPEGTSSQVYAHNIAEKIIKHFDFLIDLHTASTGRINTLYVRANMQDPVIANMAVLQEPRIIVNNAGDEGSLRFYASNVLDIPSITLEIGDPQVFQSKHIRPSIFGLNNVLVDLGMIDEEMEEIDYEPVICESSEWIYSENGGILEVHVHLTDKVAKGQKIATIRDLFGKTIEEIKSPYDAVIVAKATNPVCDVGARVVHLGTIWKGFKPPEV